MSVPQEQYKPVHRCIYCGSKGGTLGLTREHIAPFSLGGTLVLPKSSCRDCAKITGAFEQTIARSMLGRLRVLFDLPTRNPKDRPKTFLISVEIDGETQEIEIPVEDHPSVPVIFPVFQMPGLLRGIPPSDIFDGATGYPALPNLEDNEARIKRIRDRFGKPIKVHVEGTTPIGPFVRLIAKFAHAQAVALFGINSFEPLLPGIILGTDSNTAFLVGGYPKNEALKEFRPDGTHKIQFALIDLKRSESDMNTGIKMTVSEVPYLVGLVHLFQHLDSPTYAAVVGIPGETLKKELREAEVHRENYSLSFALPSPDVMAPSS